jgi:anti-sigma-K factor RskA
MHDTGLQDHLTIVGLLPDFVLGKLDETTLRRVARHLELCPICRDECANAMNVLGTLALLSPPAGLRGAVLRRAAQPRPGRQENDAPQQPVRQKGRAAVPLRLLPGDERPRSLPFGQPLSRRVLVAASAAVFLASGLLGLNYERQYVGLPSIAFQDDRTEALLNDPAAAYPLDDSDLSSATTGVVFAQPTGRELYLIANGLPALPPDQRYQVWLFARGDRVVSLGTIAPGANGEVRALLEAPSPFDTYIALSLTAEPASGKRKPSSEEVLGGSFPVESAALSPAIDAAENGTS